jgi:HK97 gp10 family phage protein
MAQATYTSNLDAILEAVKTGIENGVGVAVGKVAAKAWQLCPVGNKARAARQSFFRSVRIGKKSWKKVRVTSRVTVSWTARKPGTLRDSIFTRVRWKDGTCLGWIKAGAEGSPDGSAYYAPFVEWGTAKMQAKPFMRPALRGVDLTDIGMSIGLELGQTTRRGVKRKVYGG